MVSMGIVLLFVGICFYIGILYTNPTILLLGFALGIVTLFSMAELLLRWFLLKCSLDIPISMAEQNTPVTVNLYLKNRLPLPSGKVKVYLGVRNQLEVSGRHQWMTFYTGRREKGKYSCKMVLPAAGCHEIDITKVRIYGIFGMFYITKKCRSFSSVLIMPQIHAAGVRITEAVRNFLGDADVYDDFRPGHDPGEIYEVREYREKDRLQSIHWKLSAKTDELMVKENSLPKACAIVLMLQMQSGKKKIPVSAYLELIASISFSLMDNKCPHFVAWYSEEKEDIRRIRVDDEESFYLFLDCYLREAVPSDKDIRQEYREKYKSEWYLHDICITQDLEIRKNGESFTKLDEKKIADECEQLELLL